MVKLIKRRFSGSILEPLIALMIILFALTAAFTVVIRANQQNNVQQTVRAQQMATSAINEAVHSRLFVNDELQENGLKIEKEFEWYEREKGLLICKINVYDNRNRLLANRTRIIVYFEKQ